jgi:hypothetical protein
MRIFLNKNNINGAYPRIFRQNFDMDATWKVTAQKWKDYTKINFDLLFLQLFYMPCTGYFHLLVLAHCI